MEASIHKNPGFSSRIEMYDAVLALTPSDFYIKDNVVSVSFKEL